MIKKGSNLKIVPLIKQCVFPCRFCMYFYDFYEHLFWKMKREQETLSFIDSEYLWKQKACTKQGHEIKIWLLEGHIYPHTAESLEILVA